MVREWVVEKDEGIRIDRYVCGTVEELSRSYLQKLLADGDVLVNGKIVKSSYKVVVGDQITLNLPDAQEPEILPEPMELDILYEDSDIILINKPKGMVVHPAAGHNSGTLVNGLMYHCKDDLSGINGVLRPGIVHRIDMDTTGVLIACKNDRAHNLIAEQLRVHSITRKYYAIVHGVIPKEDGVVDAPIGRHPVDRKKMSVNTKNGREAITHYHVLKRYRRFTYVECQLETGRTHQIRVHMASIGHPILGDTVYGPSKCPFPGLQGQTLHAGVLGIIHPSSGEYMEFHASLPSYFEALLRKLEQES
ncbi:MAG: RluA family pseudouridine synthase [Clostridiales bacterium]|nr:RluA family pseudouridine synthase [Clostridiales bacterium]